MLLEQGGLRLLLLRVTQRLCAPLLEFGSVTFFARELENEVPEVSAGINLRLRWASFSDSILLHEGRHGALSEETLHRLFKLFAWGEHCVIALGPDGRVVHSRRVTTQRGYIPELDMDLVPRADEAYFYDGYTRPDLRGLGIDGRVRSFIFRNLRAAGMRRVYSYVRGDNPVALRAARRWQRPAAKVRYLRLGSLRPWVFPQGKPESPVLVKTAARRGDAKEELDRARAWRAWFEGWQREPLARRSTGYHALPEECFSATAEHIASVLRLDPGADFVLDVGCDSAMVSRVVAPRCRGFVGVDFISGMLADISRGAVKSAAGSPALFVGADGRLLPFRSAVFTKAYCSAVLHTLPSREDGLRMLRELLRVCKPGGEVLAASLPDTAKRLTARYEFWRQASFAGRVRLLISLFTPRPVKNLLRRFLRLSQGDRLFFLEYDLQALKRELEAEGLQCRILDFPADYWSRDFRKTRSNLLIRVPGEATQPSAVRGGL